VLTSFSIFSSVALPKPNSPEFQENENKDQTSKKEGKEKELMKTRLEKQWTKFKFDLDS